MLRNLQDLDPFSFNGEVVSLAADSYRTLTWVGSSADPNRQCGHFEGCVKDLG